MSGINTISAYVNAAQYNTETLKASQTKDKDGKTTTTVTYEKTAAQKQTAAAVFEKSSDAAQVEGRVQNSLPGRTERAKKPDMGKIQQLITEAEEKKEAFRQMIEKLFTKQSEKTMIAKTLADYYRGIEVPDEVREQARKDIAEDGYWGVEQTSDRILSFAQAIAGDNPEMAAKMLDAVKEGFKIAGDEWGEDLPELSQKTMSVTLDKMNSWISGLGGNNNVTGEVSAAYYSESTSVYTESLTITT